MLSRLAASVAILFVVVVLATGCQSSSQSKNAWTQAQSNGWHHYGHSVTPKSQPVAFGSLHDGDYTLLEAATITEVCPTKGCWMRVKNDAGEEMFVRFQDYSFFVPRNAAGHRIMMHGTAVKQLMSVEELRHYAEDAGKSAAEIAAITEPQEQIMFFADSVYIAGDGLDAPHEQ